MQVRTRLQMIYFVNCYQLGIMVRGAIITWGCGIIICSTVIIKDIILIEAVVCVAFLLENQPYLLGYKSLVVSSVDIFCYY